MQAEDGVLRALLGVPYGYDEQSSRDRPSVLLTLLLLGRGGIRTALSEVRWQP